MSTTAVFFTDPPTIVERSPMVFRDDMKTDGGGIRDGQDKKLTNF
ncbi:hypothetical protein Hanom_Chr09g00868121 [Helianthus anomalus]